MAGGPLEVIIDDFEAILDDPLEEQSINSQTDDHNLCKWKRLTNES